MAFAAFAPATPLILNVFVADNHSLQTASRYIAKVINIPTGNLFLCLSCGQGAKGKGLRAKSMGQRAENKIIVFCLLPFFFCLLTFAFCFCLLPFAFCLLPFNFCLLTFAFCLLPFVFCLLSFVFCLLTFAFCLLPFAFCLLILSFVFCLLIFP
jgi:hypothetical protein